MKLTQNQIEKMESLGANRWTNYGKDRLYLGNVKPEALGFEVSYYNTGSICFSEIDGEKVSHSRMGRLLGTYAEAYIDLETGNFENFGRFELDFVTERFESLLEDCNK